MFPDIPFKAFSVFKVGGSSHILISDESGAFAFPFL